MRLGDDARSILAEQEADARPAGFTPEEMAEYEEWLARFDVADLDEDYCSFADWWSVRQWEAERVAAAPAAVAAGDGGGGTDEHPW